MGGRPKGGGAPEENWEHETQRYRQASGELRLTAATQPHSAQNIRKLLLQLRNLRFERRFPFQHVAGDGRYALRYGHLGWCP